MKTQHILNILSNSIQMVTAIHGVPVFQQNDEANFFADGNNDIFVHIELDAESEDIEAYVRIRDGYEKIERTKARAEKIEAAINSLFSDPMEKGLPWINRYPQFAK